MDIAGYANRGPLLRTASCVFVKQKQEYILLNNSYLEEVYRIMGNDIETSEIL